MVLTPADVHNVAFSRARIGKRGYSEQEVDLFIDLVEQDLIRHIEEDAELRHRNAELRNRDGGLQKREVELAEREVVLHEHECEVRKHEVDVRKQQGQLRQHEAHLTQKEAQLAQRGTPLPQQVAQLRYREAQVAQREAQLAQHEAQLAHQEAHLSQQEAKLRQREAELAQWETELRHHEAAFEQHEAELAQREAEIRRQVTERSYPQPQPLRAVPTPVAVNGVLRLGETRAVAAMHGRHDVERMAIRAVTDTLGNTVTETVHERTRRSAIDEQSAELEQLRQENAELARSLGLLKSAAALLAAALDRP
jgi:DivIVA domain-containing protein